MKATNLAGATLETDKKARFREFYRLQFELVVRLLLKMGADKCEAEDATQEAMKALWQRFDEINDARAWIRVVARNNWLAALRHQNAMVPTDLRDQSSDLRVDRTQLDSDPADILRHEIDRAAAARVVASLPQVQREIFELVVDGHKPRDIASMTGRDPALVRSNLAHARRRLREQIRRRGEVRARKAC
jgi:RNA polymerase sigma factor (sigma-70 family)